MVLVVIAVTYALLSGFWGVVVTDLVQFVIAMVGAVALAVIALNHVGGVEQMMSKLDTTLVTRAEMLQTEIDEKTAEIESASPEDLEIAEKELTQLQAKFDASPKSATDAVRMFPPVPNASVFSSDFLYSNFFHFIVLVTVMWWSNHATDGGGYLTQRTMAAKDERHAMLANLWYNFANFALRTWPWVIVALVSMVMFEDLSAEEMGEKSGYPLVMRELLGSGMRGLLLVSFLAAFMSTIDTHLNWASSYLVHDIYRRFVKPDENEKHYVVAGKIVTVVLMVVAAIIAKHMMSIEKAWKFVMAMGGGIGLVLILRWFWWRINAWSEIAALATSVLVTIGFEVMAAQQTIAAGEPYLLFGVDPVVAGRPFPFHLQLIVIVALSMAVWITVTFLTRPEPEETLREFYALVQPGGWWGTIAESVPTTKPSVAKGFIFNFGAGLMFVWGGMFCIGYLIFQQWQLAGISAAVMVAGFGHVWYHCIREAE